MNASQQIRQLSTRLNDLEAVQSRIVNDDDGNLPLHRLSIHDSEPEIVTSDVIEDIPTTPLEIPSVMKQSLTKSAAFQSVAQMNTLHTAVQRFRNIAQANALYVATQQVEDIAQAHTLHFAAQHAEDIAQSHTLQIAALRAEDITQADTLQIAALRSEDIAQAHTLELAAQHSQNARSWRSNLRPSNIGAVATTLAEMNAVLVQPAAQRASAPIIQFPRSDEQLSMPGNVVSQESTQATVTNIAKAKKKNKLPGLVLRIGCTILLFVFLFKSFSWSSLLGILKNVDQGQLLVGFIVGLFCIVVSAYQWKSLLSAERIKSDLADLIDLYFIGIAFSHFLPTGMGGDAIKAVRVGDTSGNKAGSASAVVMSRLTGFFGMLFIGIPVLLIWHAYFNQTIILWFFVLSLLVAGMIGGAVFFAVMLPRIVKGKWITHKAFQSGIKIGKALSIAMQRPRSLSIAILWGVIFWMCSCVNHYAYGMALGIHVPFFFYCVAVPFISLVTFLPISINGFGLREGAFVYIFSTMHISPATALLLALLMDAQALLFGSMGGCFYLVTGGKKASDEKKHRAA